MLKHKYFPTSDSLTVQNEALVETIFKPKDVELILNIPTNRGRPDALRWHYEQHGCYSLRSVYLVMIKEGGTWGTSGASSSSSHCSNVSGEQLFPQRCNCVAWKIFHEALSTAARLAPCGVRIDDGCPWCSDEVEDVLLRCHYPRLVWALSSLPYS
ncbi:UNVERIFIED_CONTAM: hypothetical protein Sindi_2496800 [Sesamum indicum]